MKEKYMIGANNTGRIAPNAKLAEFVNGIKRTGGFNDAELNKLICQETKFSSADLPALDFIDQNVSPVVKDLALKIARIKANIQPISTPNHFQTFIRKKPEVSDQKQAAKRKVEDKAPPAYFSDYFTEIGELEGLPAGTVMPEELSRTKAVGKSPKVDNKVIVQFAIHPKTGRPVIVLDTEHLSKEASKSLFTSLTVTNGVEDKNTHAKTYHLKKGYVIEKDNGELITGSTLKEAFKMVTFWLDLFKIDWKYHADAINNLEIIAAGMEAFKEDNKKVKSLLRFVKDDKHTAVTAHAREAETPLAEESDEMAVDWLDIWWHQAKIDAANKQACGEENEDNQEVKSLLDFVKGDKHTAVTAHAREAETFLAEESDEMAVDWLDILDRDWLENKVTLQFAIHPKTGRPVIVLDTEHLSKEASKSLFTSLTVTNGVEDKNTHAKTYHLKKGYVIEKDNGELITGSTLKEAFKMVTFWLDLFKIDWKYHADAINNLEIIAAGMEAFKEDNKKVKSLLRFVKDDKHTAVTAHAREAETPLAEESEFLSSAEVLSMQDFLKSQNLL